MRKFRPLRRASAFALLGVAAAVPAAAEEVIAVTSDNTLVTFDTASPGSIDSSHAISGVSGAVVAIDVRPADGSLYALTDTGRVYRIDRTSGVAVAVGSGPMTIVPSGDVGMDFDSVTDDARVVTDTEQNYRFNPNDALVENGVADSPLAYVVGDDDFLVNPNVTALAFTSGFPGNRTTAFVIDAGLDVLARLGDADGPDSTRNAGQLHTIGILGVNATDLTGFDISRASGNAYAVMTIPGEPTSRLFAISLFTGAATSLGAVGDPRPIRAMTIGPATPASPPPSVDLVGLTTGGELVQFASDSSTTIEHRVAVTGLVPGDSLVSIALRPQNRRLYGLSSGSRLYVLNVVTGQASVIRQQPFEVALSGTRFGFDFNPQSDVARITSDTGQNMRVMPDTGAVVDADDTTPGVQADAPLAYPSGDPFATPNPDVVAAAYDRTGVRSGTTLYGIDSGTDVLVRVGSRGGAAQSPNTGQLHSVGPLGTDAAEFVGFEIAGDAVGVATFSTTPGGVSRLFSVDLDSGTATLIGDVGTGETLRAVSVTPSSNPPAPGADLRTSRMSVHLDFRRDGRDAVSLSGTLPFPALGRGGRTVTVNVGGFAKTFVLDDKGRGRLKEDTRSAADDDAFQFVGKPADGRVHFVAFLRRETLKDDLADEGLTGDADVRREDRTIRVTIGVDDAAYAADVVLRYSVKAGKTGTAVKP